MIRKVFSVWMLIIQEASMSHTYVSSLVHVVFSTKDRKRFLLPEIQERLWPFISGVAKSHSINTLAIGGLEDHAHVLLSMPADIALSRAMQSIKGDLIQMDTRKLSRFARFLLAGGLWRL